MKSFYVHQVVQQQILQIQLEQRQQQHNHHQEMFAMVKDLILMLIGVTMVVFVLKVKKHAAQIHMPVIKNRCINVLTDSFDQYKRILSF